MLSLCLIYGLSFRIRAAQPIFNRVELNIEPSSLLKPTKVGLIFIGPNSFTRAEDLAAVNLVTQAVVRVGSKIKSKSRELRLELKFLNRELWILESHCTVFLKSKIFPLTQDIFLNPYLFLRHFFLN